MRGEGPQPSPSPPGQPPVWVQAGQPPGGLQPGRAERVPSPVSSGAPGLRGGGGHILSALGRRSPDRKRSYPHRPDGETEAARETQALHPGRPTAGQASTVTHPPWSPKTWTQRDPEPTSQEQHPGPDTAPHTWQRGAKGSWVLPFSALSCPTLQPHGRQHARPPCPRHLLELAQTHVH